jgi:hypothetical protein
VFLVKLFLLFRRVGANSDGFHSRPGQICLRIAHALGLDGSAQGVCFGVEIQEKFTALEIRELYFPALLVFQFKIGCLIPCFKLWHKPFLRNTHDGIS